MYALVSGYISVQAGFVPPAISDGNTDLPPANASRNIAQLFPSSSAIKG